jgi:hypothetical protein
LHPERAESSNTPATPAAFASAVRAALGGDTFRTQAALDTARRFSLRAAAVRYFAAYDELAGQFGPIAPRAISVPSSARR